MNIQAHFSPFLASDSVTLVQPVDKSQEDRYSNKQQQSSPNLPVNIKLCIYYIYNIKKVKTLIQFRCIKCSILQLFTGISNGLQTEEIVPPKANCGTGIRRLNGVYKNGERKSE